MKKNIFLFICFLLVSCAQSTKRTIANSTTHSQDKLFELSLAKEKQISNIYEKLRFIYQDELRLFPNFKLISNRSNSGMLGDIYIETRKQGDPILLWVNLNHNYNLKAVPFIMCHEVGHFLGGYAKKIKNNYGTVEPEADYFAAADCLRKLFLLDKVKNKEMAEKIKLPNFYKNLCQQESEHPFVCIRIIDSFASFFGYHSYKKWAFFIPLHEKNEEIFYAAYPSDRCRFLTGVAGAICRPKIKSLVDIVISEGVESFLDNDIRHYCENKQAQRPTCWYPLKIDRNW